MKTKKYKFITIMKATIDPGRNHWGVTSNRTHLSIGGIEYHEGRYVFWPIHRSDIWSVGDIKERIQWLQDVIDFIQNEIPKEQKGGEGK